MSWLILQTQRATEIHILRGLLSLNIAKKIAIYKLSCSIQVQLSCIFVCIERVAVSGDGDGVLKLDKWTLAVLGDQ